jgi:hypothetical protein
LNLGRFWQGFWIGVHFSVVGVPKFKNTSHLRFPRRFRWTRSLSPTVSSPSNISKIFQISKSQRKPMKVPQAPKVRENGNRWALVCFLQTKEHVEFVTESYWFKCGRRIHTVSYRGIKSGLFDQRHITKPIRSGQYGALRRKWEIRAGLVAIFFLRTRGRLSTWNPSESKGARSPP